MKTAKYEMFYKDKMSFEEYEARAKKIARAVFYNGLMNKMDDYAYHQTMLELTKFGDIFNFIYQYIEVMGNDPKSYTSIEGIIAEEIQFTSEESFCRWGDRNHLTNQIRKNYLSKKDYWTLDVQATRLSEEYNKEITENDLIEFICKYPKGSHTYKNEIEVQKEEIMQQFEIITGFKLSENFIKKYLQMTNSIQETDGEICPF